MTKIIALRCRQVNSRRDSGLLIEQTRICHLSVFSEITDAFGKLLPGGIAIAVAAHKNALLCHDPALNWLHGSRDSIGAPQRRRPHRNAKHRDFTSSKANAAAYGDRRRDLRRALWL
ncbi:hypothetical protein [Acidisoma silvae]|uniref:hypothetical protein n=1 Tax=Acidisoma silvae TaxID=2802396 RepID=UPI001D0A882C|nr:hypothetical protein [Acidisoma silvae]